MTTTASNHGGNPSSAWDETAAGQLLQMKHQQPSRTECRAASELMRVILQSTDDSRRRRNPALLHAGDASNQSTKSTMALVNNGISNISDLPIPIADSRDGLYLSQLQRYVRKHCAEYFAATASNAATKGRQTPVLEGRIGVRCAFCKHLPRDQQAAQATSFPNQISSISSSVVMLQCRHFPMCREMPDSVRDNLATLKKAGNSAPSSSGNKRQEYWADRARDMGFVDTDGGIRFVPRAVEMSSKMSSDSKTLKDDVLPSTNDLADEVNVFPESTTALGLPRPNVVSPFELIVSSVVSINYELLVKGSEFVTLNDRGLVPDHVFLSLAQLQPCQFTGDDRIGVYKSREIGFQGLCCRYCQGCQPGPGYGKYFPNSSRSLAQTTTTQTIVKHITTKCKHVPKDVKYAIDSLAQEANKDSKPAYAPKSSNDSRPKYGSRKQFFQRIWDRLHGCDHAIASTQSYDKPVMMATENKKVFRPTPIRHGFPVSSNDVSLRLDNNNEFDFVSSDDESLCMNHDLFDDRNRRVTITGAIFSTNEGKKRLGAFTNVTVSRKKLKV